MGMMVVGRTDDEVDDGRESRKVKEVGGERKDKGKMFCIVAGCGRLVGWEGEGEASGGSIMGTMVVEEEEEGREGEKNTTGRAKVRVEDAEALGWPIALDGGNALVVVAAIAKGAEDPVGRGRRGVLRRRGGRLVSCAVPSAFSSSFFSSSSAPAS